MLLGPRHDERVSRRPALSTSWIEGRPEPRGVPHLCQVEVADAPTPTLVDLGSS